MAFHPKHTLTYSPLFSVKSSSPGAGKPWVTPGEKVCRVWATLGSLTWDVDAMSQFLGLGNVGRELLSLAFLCFSYSFSRCPTHSAEMSTQTLGFVDSIFNQVQLPGGQIWQLCIHSVLLWIHLCWEDGDYFNGA